MLEWHAPRSQGKEKRKLDASTRASVLAQCDERLTGGAGFCTVKNTGTSEESVEPCSCCYDRAHSAGPELVDSELSG